MHLLSRFIIALGVTGWFVSPAAAQRIVFPPPTDFAPIHLLRNESVQKELKLTEVQVAKLKELFSQNQENSKEIWQKFPPEEAGPQWQALTTELRKESLAILDETQRKRFWQIDFQNTVSFGFVSSSYGRPD